MRNKTSFTLIEMLIVFAIISVVTGLSLASYNDYTAKKDVHREAQMFADTLELARKKANAAEELSYGEEGLTCIYDSGYMITITSSTAYKLERICENEDDTYTTLLSQYTLKKTQIIGYTFPDTVLFKPLNQIAFKFTDPDDIGRNYTIQSLQDPNKNVGIIVSKEGIVYGSAESTFQGLPAPTTGDAPTAIPEFPPYP